MMFFFVGEWTFGLVVGAASARAMDDAHLVTAIIIFDAIDVG